MDLGYAVVDEVIGGWMTERWISDCGYEDPLTAIGRSLIASLEKAGPKALQCGCPLNNLAQEMSPIDEGFRTRIARLFGRWRRGLADSLGNGQTLGTVRTDIDSEKVAAFIIGAIEGAIGLGKSEQSEELLRGNIEVLLDYLETLRPLGAPIPA
jgi:hypothetical protein